MRTSAEPYESGYEPKGKILLLIHLGPACCVLQLLRKLLQLPVCLSPRNCQLCQVSRFTPLLLTLQLGVLLLQVQQGILNKETLGKKFSVMNQHRFDADPDPTFHGSCWKQMKVMKHFLLLVHFLEADYSGS
jgi:hypothetical protein